MSDLTLSLVVFGAAFGLGYATAGSRAEEAAARKAAEIDQANIAVLRAAQVRGDQLIHDLATAREAAAQLREQLDEALRRKTTGRVCLAQPALRVLHDSGAVRIDLPATTGGAAATAGRFASDTDVSLWIGHAAAQYAECRRRLDALIDWHQEQETTRDPR